MPLYEATVSATSNVANGTADAFIEILAAAGSALKIKRVKVAVTTPASDSRTLVALLRNSAAGATGTAGTAVKLDSTQRASSATVLVKNGTTAFTVGTTTNTFELDACNGRGRYEWIPANPREELTVEGGAYFVVSITSDTNSVVHRVSVVWED